MRHLTLFVVLVTLTPSVSLGATFEKVGLPWFDAHVQQIIQPPNQGPEWATKARLFLHPAAPGNVNNIDLGDGFAWIPENPNVVGIPEVSPVTDCTGNELQCETYVGIPANWQAVAVVGGTPYLVTSANCKHYWDTKYALYDSDGQLDFTQNCHGYTFDEGHWISGAMADDLADDCNYNPVWPATKAQAFFSAAVGFKHSLQVTMKVCGAGAIIETTSEQNRESGVYSRDDGDCGAGLEVHHPHTSLDEDDFTLYYDGPPQP